jgi:hypothetical protein
MLRNRKKEKNMKRKIKPYQTVTVRGETYDDYSVEAKAGICDISVCRETRELYIRRDEWQGTGDFRMGKLEKIKEFLRELDHFEVDEKYKGSEATAFVDGMEFALRRVIEILKNSRIYKNDFPL